MIWAQPLNASKDLRMRIAKDSVVSFDYTLWNDKGEELDSSSGGDPLFYLHGSGNIIPGLERALEGKEVGAKLQVVVAPVDGYGERDDKLVRIVNRSNFKAGQKLEAGMQFRANTAEGPRLLTIVNIEGDKITLDANHPLAGATLRFEVEVREVRVPTKEELEHGHVHGPGGHHHH
jgi:FKBP-type peptidyl-prolyl cis-trans isomerase SlyD